MKNLASLLGATSKKKASERTSTSIPVSQNIKVIARFRPQIAIEHTVVESEKSIEY